MKRFNKYLPSLTTALIILILTSIPGKTINSVGLNKESYNINVHFIMYFFFCFTLYKGSKSPWASFFGSVLYGILMELYQKVVPGRAFQYLDIAINSFGSLLALGILWKRSLILPKKLINWLEK